LRTSKEKSVDPYQILHFPSFSHTRHGGWAVTAAMFMASTAIIVKGITKEQAEKEAEYWNENGDSYTVYSVVTTEEATKNIHEKN